MKVLDDIVDKMLDYPPTLYFAELIIGIIIGWFLAWSVILI